MCYTELLSHLVAQIYIGTTNVKIKCFNLQYSFWPPTLPPWAVAPPSPPLSYAPEPSVSVSYGEVTY
jgi:hypothetical protein